MSLPFLILLVVTLGECQCSLPSSAPVSLPHLVEAPAPLLRAQPLLAEQLRAAATALATSRMLDGPATARLLVDGTSGQMYFLAYKPGLQVSRVCTFACVVAANIVVVSLNLAQLSGYLWLQADGVVLTRSITGLDLVELRSCLWVWAVSASRRGMFVALSVGVDMSCAVVILCPFVWRI